MNIGFAKRPLHCLAVASIAAALLFFACGDKKKADEKAAVQAESGTPTEAVDSGAGSAGEAGAEGATGGVSGETAIDFMYGTWVYVPSDDSPNYWKKRPPFITINADRSVSALFYEVHMKGVFSRIDPHRFSARILSTLEDGKEMPARDNSEFIMRYDSAANIVRLTSDKGFDDDKHPFKKVDDAATDSLAALFAAKAYNFASFPFTSGSDYFPIREGGGGDKINFEWFIPDMPNRDAFMFLFRQAYYQKERPLGGWLAGFAKRIAAHMPVKTYVANGYDAITRQLLVAYDDLSARPDAFRDVYGIMAANRGASVDAYGEILPFACPERLGVFVKERGDDGYAKKGEVNKWGVVWAYSFWGRRHHENPANVEPIAATLRMLRDELFKFQPTGKAATIPAKCPERFGTLTHAGQTYKTVRIGKQMWMAENLNSKAENSWCYDNSEPNCNKYGRLYSWSAAAKACPAGWRLPSNDDWANIAMSVGGQAFENDYETGYGGAGKRLKSKWGASLGADSYRFAAMPGGGYNYNDGSFYNVGANGFWWSASEDDAGAGAYRWSMASETDNVYMDHSDKGNGFSVRCVKN